MRVVTLRLLKPPPWGVVRGRLEEDAGAAECVPGLAVDTDGAAAAVDLLAGFDFLDVEFGSRFLEDVKGGIHDFRADAIAFRHRDGGAFCHRGFPTKIDRARRGEQPTGAGGGKWRGERVETGVREGVERGARGVREGIERGARGCRGV